MDFSADIPLAYADFGDTVTHRSAASGMDTIGFAILDAPGTTLIGDDVLGTNYTLRYSLMLFPDVHRGDTFTIGETIYTVREGSTSANADGSERMVPLSLG